MFGVQVAQGILDRSEGRWTPITRARHLMNLPLWDFEIFTPFHNKHRLPVYRNTSVVASIACLLAFGGPYAIFWRVVAVIVFPLNGVGRGRLGPHVCQKSLKRDQPLLADFDPALAVSLVFFVIGVVASILHRRPCGIFWRVASVVGSLIGVAAQRCGALFFSEAATTKFGAAKIGCGSNSDVTAVALALPHYVARGWDNRSFNYHKPPKSHSCDNIQDTWHSRPLSSELEYRSILGTVQ